MPVIVRSSGHPTAVQMASGLLLLRKALDDAAAIVNRQLANWIVMRQDTAIMLSMICPLCNGDRTVFSLGDREVPCDVCASWPKKD